MVSSYEPGEDWFSDYEKQRMINGAELLPPHSHPGHCGKSSTGLGITPALIRFALESIESSISVLKWEVKGRASVPFAPRTP